LHGSGDLADDPVGGHALTIGHMPAHLDIAVEYCEHTVKPGSARQYRSLATDHMRGGTTIVIHKRGVAVAVADVLGYSVVDDGIQICGVLGIDHRHRIGVYELDGRL